jgi:hypothetical protein
MTLARGWQTRGLYSFRAVIAFIVASAILGSCASAEKLPGVDVPIRDMNTQLSLSLPAGSENLKKDDPIPLVAQDLSEEPIVFPQDYGIKVFARQDQKWIPVENNFHYPAGDVELLPAKQQAFGGMGIVLDPVISQAAPVVIRVVVVGHLQHNNQVGLSVAAYLDITLQP